MGQATEGPHTRLRALVLRPSQEETTFAIVTARRTAHIHSATQLLQPIVAAVTAWVRNTPQGRAAYEDSARDYNVGDLLNDLDEPTLSPYLEAEGLHDVEIELHSDDDFQNNWTFDTPLVVAE